MSYWRNITVVCDGCKIWEAFSTLDARTVREARKLLKKAGWRTKKGKDYCPKCSEGG